MKRANLRLPQAARDPFEQAFLSGLVAIVLGGCGESSERPGAAAVVERDSAGVRVVELSDIYVDSLPRWRLQDQPYLLIGEVAGRPEYELFRVTGATVLPDGSIALANAGTGEIRIFDYAGHHVRTFGRQGDGPGEFSTLSWLGLASGDTLLASFDTDLRRLTWFTENGEVVLTLPLDRADAGGFPEPVGMLNGRMLVRSGFDRVFGQGERRDTIRLFLYDELGTLADTIGAYAGPERYFYRAPGGEFSTRFEPIFARDTHASAFAGRLVVGSSDRLELDVHDGVALSMRVIARARLPPVSVEDIESWRRDLRQQQANLPEEFRQLMLDAIDGIPARQSTPAFQRLVVDSERFIWIEEPPRIPRQPRSWVVLAEDGIPKARVVTPPALEVLAIGEDYVLGLMRDEHGVERVAAYALKRTS